MHVKPVENEREMQMAKAIRHRVFVEEQHCPPEEEWDVFEASSRHLVGLVDGKAVATARWRTVPFEGHEAAKLERFAVLLEFRGRGFGRDLVRHVIGEVQAAGYPAQVLHAQAHLQAFYESFGFQAVGERFVEAGIVHVKMVRREM